MSGPNVLLMAEIMHQLIWRISYFHWVSKITGGTGFLSSTVLTTYKSWDDLPSRDIPLVNRVLAPSQVVVWDL